MGWMVIAGSIPIGVIGLVFEDAIRGALRNLWITAAMLILFSFVFIAAERVGSKKRGFEELTMKDAIIMGRHAVARRHRNCLRLGLRLDCVVVELRGQPLLCMVRGLPHPSGHPRDDSAGLGSPTAHLNHPISSR